jgi:hypothetical protein
VLEQMPRHAAEDKLTKPRVAIGASYYQVDAIIGDIR